MKPTFIAILLITGILISCRERGKEWAVKDQYDRTCVSDEKFSGPIRISEQLMREAVRLNGAPGGQIAVAVDGKMRWSANFGYANLETQVAVNANTIFRIGSISKIMTAVAVGKLMESGRLDIDKPVIQYLPELPAHYAGITTRHLVSHQSGIRHYYGADGSEKEKHYDDIVDAFPLFVNAPLLFAPGTRSEYSSYGWLVVSAVIQRVSARPFLQYLQDEIWIPSGMKNTFGTIPETRQHEVTHFYTRRANRNAWNEAPFQDLSFNWGGAGISSNANDLVALGNALMDGKLLKPETLKAMFEENLTATQDSTGVGIGFMHFKEGNQTIIGHGGFMPTGRSYLFLFPNSNMVIAYTSNSAIANFSDENLVLIANLFQKEMSTEKYAVDTADISGWTGPWSIEIEKDDGGFEEAKLSFHLEGNKFSGNLKLEDSVVRNLNVVTLGRDSIRMTCVFRTHTAWIELRRKNGAISGKSYFKKPLTHSLSKTLRSEQELRRLLAPKEIRGE